MEWNSSYDWIVFLGINLVLALLFSALPVNAELWYRGQQCSESPADYDTFNETGFSFINPAFLHVMMDTTVTTGEYTLLMLNFYVGGSDATYPYLYLEQPSGHRLTQTWWKNDDWGANDDSAYTKLADAPDEIYYNWSMNWVFEADNVDYYLDDILVGDDFGLNNHNNDFSQIEVRDTAGEVSATAFYVFEGDTCPAYGPSDTCTYGGSGNWTIECSDNCDPSATDVDGHIILNGVGTLTVSNELKAHSLAVPPSCRVNITGGTLALGS